MPLYKREDSPIWWVNIRHAGRRVRRSTGTDDRAAAQKIHNEIQVELWALVPNTTERLWSDAIELWLNARERSDPEIYNLAKFGRAFRDRVLSDVTADAVEEALEDCVAASTHTRYRAMILSILNLAKKRGWIKTIPALHARARGKKKTRDWLTTAQWLALKAELPLHLRVAAEFALETGLRQSNVLQLRWDQVDLKAKRAWFEADEMKADSALAVPLNAAALKVLRGQVGQHPEFVFVYHGRPVKEVKTAFIKACVRAGLGKVEIDPEGHKHYEGFTWHGFRHTWATWHVQNGTPLDVLQKLGGWSDLRMVMNYSHHSPGHLASFANNNRKKK